MKLEKEMLHEIAREVLIHLNEEDDCIQVEIASNKELLIDVIYDPMEIGYTHDGIVYNIRLMRLKNGEYEPYFLRTAARFGDIHSLINEIERYLAPI